MASVALAKEVGRLKFRHAEPARPAGGLDSASHPDKQNLIGFKICEVLFI